METPPKLGTDWLNPAPAPAAHSGDHRSRLQWKQTRNNEATADPTRERGAHRHVAALDFDAACGTLVHVHVLVIAAAHAEALDDLDGAHLTQKGCTLSVIGHDLREVERALEDGAPAAVVIDSRRHLLAAGPAIGRVRRTGALCSIPILLGISPWHVGELRPGVGADDFVVLPATAEELWARLRRLLARSRPRAPGAVVIDPESMSVTVGGRSVRLAPRELQVLSVLSAEAGRAFTRAELGLRGWGARPGRQTRTVDIHVRWLREKLGPDGGMVETVRGVGYRLRATA